MSDLLLHAHGKELRIVVSNILSERVHKSLFIFAKTLNFKLIFIFPYAFTCWEHKYVLKSFRKCF